MAEPAAAGAGPAGDGDGDLRPDDWGRHLRADYRHDKLDPKKFYNIGRNGPDAKDPTRGGSEFGEAEFQNYTMKLPYIQTNAEFKARMAGRVEFVLPTKTMEFDGSPPQFFDGGNGMIALIMDAGKNVTDYIGAQNAISFGMCIDPAGSSVGKKDKPVFFEPAVRKVYVELKQFGFDPEVIRGIWIADVLEGTLVKSVWVMGDGKLIDPVQRKVIGELGERDAFRADILTPEIIGALGSKPINVTNPERAGFYTSIANAIGGVERQKNVLNDPDFFKMGKTLGDTMIVASAMPKFKRYFDNGRFELYDNPFYGIGDEYRDRWFNHFNRNNEYPYPDRPPRTVLVKTGDRLNAVRAIFKGVPVILERQSAGGKPKFFEFYPGTPSPLEVISAIGPGYDRLMNECERRYTDLIASFNGAVEGGKYRAEYSKFATDKRATLFRLADKKAETAAALVENIVRSLGVLRSLTVEFLRQSKTSTLARMETIQTKIKDRVITLSDIEEVRTMYSNHTQIMLMISPQTTSIRTDSGVKPLIVIATPGPGGVDIGEGKKIYDMEIPIFAAVSAIEEGKNVGQGILDDKFFNRVPPSGPAPSPPEPVVSPGRFAYYTEKLRQWVDFIAGYFVGKKGGVRIKNYPKQPAITLVPGGQAVKPVAPPPVTLLGGTFSSDIVSMTTAFTNYMASHGVRADMNASMNMIFKLLQMSGSDRIVDEYVLQTIEREFFVLKSMEHIDFPVLQAAAAGPAAAGAGDPRDVSIQRIPSEASTEASLLFGAFVMNINAENLDIRYENVRPNNPFSIMELRFLEHLDALRAGRRVGGLRRTFRQKHPKDNKDATVTA